MRWRLPIRRIASSAALATALGLGVGIVGCRTTTDDVHRWANTAQGPRKLVAVMTHDKYPLDLRIEAAMTLVTMRPRSGQRIGITHLVEALDDMPPADRNKIVSGMVPILDEGIRRDPSKGDDGARIDPSVPYKDAAFALLQNEDGSLVASEAERDRLREALRHWALADFPGRMDDSSQKYGIEQVLRALGQEGVAGLPDLIQPDALKIDRMADLVADMGSSETKTRASKKLVGVARKIDSDAWLKEQTPKLRTANEASKLTPTEDQFKKQLAQFQEEELLRVFTSMKKVGEKPIVEYLLGYAIDKSNPEKRRAAALAALEGNLDRNDKAQVDKILALAGGEDTPNTVRDVALRRVGEMPRGTVVGALYKLFDHDNWKIRWVAAELVLKMSTASQLGEFMGRLGRIQHMALTEPLRYGKLIGDLRGKPSPTELVASYAQSRHSTPVRLSALGYYYDHGTKADLAKIEPFIRDRTKVPECRAEAEECEWRCTVGSGERQQVKEITTIGEFVEHCVKPAMLNRDKEGPKASEEQK